jgi:hypothetical protein
VGDRRVPGRPSRPWASVASLGVRRVPGRPSRPCLAPWVRAKVPSSVMAHRCFWRWRVQRLFGLLLSRLQAGPLLLRCGHLRGCLVSGPLHRCAVEWSTCEASNSHDTALTAAMRVRGGSGQVLLPCATSLATGLAIQCTLYFSASSSRHQQRRNVSKSWPRRACRCSPTIVRGQYYIIAFQSSAVLFPNMLFIYELLCYYCRL